MKRERGVTDTTSFDSVFREGWTPTSASRHSREPRHYPTNVNANASFVHRRRESETTTASSPPFTAAALHDLTMTRKRTILLICCVSLFMNYLDSTILNVALPSIQRAFHADEAALQWIVDSFLLVLTCLLILAGSLADRFGRKRLLLGGLVIFTLGSLGCSFAQSVSQLIVARMITGIGGSMLVPTTLSVLRNTYIDRRELARAIGVWSGVYGLACACGPIVGGTLVDTVGWRSIFFVNIPVGIVGFLFAAKFVPESTADHIRAIDLKGQALVIAVLGTLVFTIIEAPTYGWSSIGVLSGFTIAIALLVTLIMTESRRDEPLIEIRFFRNPSFAGANTLAVITFILMTGFLFLNTIYLQQVRGLSAFQAGLYTLPLMAAIALSAPISGRYLSKFGPRHAMTLTPIMAIAAFALLFLSSAFTSAWHLFVAYAILGLALGTVNPTITHTSVAAMPARQAGVASAITSTSRQIGSSFGVAVLGSIAVTALQGHINAGLATLRLPKALEISTKHLGISALRASLSSNGESIHQIALAGYVSALHLVWIICIALCVIWFVVARRLIAPQDIDVPATNEVHDFADGE